MTSPARTYRARAAAVGTHTSCRRRCPADQGNDNLSRATDSHHLVGFLTDIRAGPFNLAAPPRTGGRPPPALCRLGNGQRNSERSAGQCPRLNAGTECGLRLRSGALLSEPRWAGSLPSKLANDSAKGVRGVVEATEVVEPILLILAVCLDLLLSGLSAGHGPKSEAEDLFGLASGQ